MMVSSIPLIARAAAHSDRPAIISPEGTFSYAWLLRESAVVASKLLQGAPDLAEERVAFLTPSGPDYVAVQWGVWRAGGIAVPLCPQHPRPEIEHVVEDADAGILVVHPCFESILRPIAEASGRRLVLTTDLLSTPEVVRELPEVSLDRRAMILYTSGTTAKPKGVVTTHRNIQAQIRALIKAWEWSANDHTLLVLPLHHVHGIVNVLCCALWAGAVCEVLPKFDAAAVWERFSSGRLTLFMAVPTIYSKLIAEWEIQPPPRREALSAACRGMRLMISGSAALPACTLERWREISGHVLLERYGMTEIGMALSNPLRGHRRPGYVGAPLPGVSVRLVDENGCCVPEGHPGEIQVKGPGVFLEYWRRPEMTISAFRDGWFCTGDIAICEGGYYRVLGRNSIDIIKSGGYKLSALEIETALLAHPAICECAVVGIEDLEWGERVAAAVVLRPGANLTLEVLRAWARERLAPYKLPTQLLCLEALPRNSMGKVIKPAVKALFTAQDCRGN